MEIRKAFFTKNECYLNRAKHFVSGIMVHSTGANNPYLKRYVDDPLNLGANQYGNHWNQFRPDGRQVCVHGFIGKDKDGKVQVYQTFPWDYIAWHCGGKGNYIGYIGFEICEDGLNDEAYFNEVMSKAQELCAYLMDEFNVKLENVICHSEGYRKGIASNHGDIEHWLKRFGKDMAWFRKCVQTIRDGQPSVEEDFDSSDSLQHLPKYKVNTPFRCTGLYSSSTGGKFISKNDLFYGAGDYYISKVYTDGRANPYEAKVKGNNAIIGFANDKVIDDEPSLPSNPVSYYPAFNNVSIVAGLKSIGVDSSFANRTKIAKANGISNYQGTAEQNTKLCNLAKNGKLVKPS